MFFTIPIFWQFVALLAVHWVADFVCQSHWMAINKSSRNDALALHVTLYTAVLLGGTGLIVGLKPQFAVLGFAALNGALHFGTDYFTSRWSSSLWKQQRMHDFFVVIGLDQLIHQVTLAITFWWLLR